jgi:hypothetical protein
LAISCINAWGLRPPMHRNRALSAGPVPNASFHSFQPSSNATYSTPFAVGAAPPDAAS